MNETLYREEKASSTVGPRRPPPISGAGGNNSVLFRSVTMLLSLLSMAFAGQYGVQLPCLACLSLSVSTKNAFAAKIVAGPFLTQRERHVISLSLVQLALFFLCGKKLAV
jgi:hypothetical protein